MTGWFIDYLDFNNNLCQTFFGDGFDSIHGDLSTLDNNLASARTTLFMFEMAHKHDFKELIGIKRGVVSNG